MPNEFSTAKFYANEKTLSFENAQAIFESKNYIDPPSRGMANSKSYLFIAPALHRDTINTFWMSVKHGYEGRRQRIIPLSIQNFVLILKILLRLRSANKFLDHTQILNLYERIGNSSNDYTDSQEWISNIQNIILSWKEIVAHEEP